MLREQGGGGMRNEGVGASSWCPLLAAGDDEDGRGASSSTERTRQHLRRFGNAAALSSSRAASSTSLLQVTRGAAHEARPSARDAQPNVEQGRQTRRERRVINCTHTHACTCLLLNSDSTQRTLTRARRLPTRGARRGGSGRRAEKPSAKSRRCRRGTSGGRG